MLQRFCVIVKGVVVNAEMGLAGHKSQFAESISIQEETAQIGWTFVGGVFKECAASIADLLQYAERRQAAILALVWKFNVGTAVEPVYAYTKLDVAGRMSATRLGLWALRNATGTATASVDFHSENGSVWKMTPSQAAMLSDGATDVEQQAFSKLATLKIAIAARAVTMLSEVDAWVWPMPKT